MPAAKNSFKLLLIMNLATIEEQAESPSAARESEPESPFLFPAPSTTLRYVLFVSILLFVLIRVCLTWKIII